jgi:hypothetical protein
MAGKKKTTSSGDLATIKIGSRVRHLSDRAEGRIVWANGTSVKIQWDDGEKVTWKRADLAGKGLEVLDANDAASPQPAALKMPPVDQVATGQAAVAEPAAAKKPRAKKANGEAGRAQKMSALDAAAKVLGSAGEPMNCQELIKAMAARGYWTSPGGKTPHATLYSAILRELTAKGADARFVKAERGKFAARP